MEKVKIDVNLIVEEYQKKLAEVEYENVLLKAQIRQILTEQQADKKEGE